MTSPSGGTPEVLTKRLRLAPVTMADLDHIAALHADERVWRHRPEGRHPSVEYTRGKVVEMEQQWARDGLGYWTIRLREPLADQAAETFVGVGGCAFDAEKAWWNLYYRLRPESHGHGLATELAQAALAAVHSRDAGLPVVARMVEGNHASRVTAERAGLRLQWRDSSAGHSGDVYLVYADRDLRRV